MILNELGQFYKGTRYKKRNDKQGNYFQYELLVAPRRVYGQVINNLIATQGTQTIRTNWDLDFKVREYIVDQQGKKWQISTIVEMSQEINPQSVAIMVDNMDTDKVLGLIEIENPEES